jgi:hypothetical protein
VCLPQPCFHLSLGALRKGIRVDMELLLQVLDLDLELPVV